MQCASIVHLYPIFAQKGGIIGAEKTAEEVIAHFRANPKECHLVIECHTTSATRLGDQRRWKGSITGWKPTTAAAIIMRD